MRMLRSLSGMGHISWKGHQQVFTGHVLLRIATTFMYIGAAIKIPALSDHPAEPDDKPECASSWRLPHLRYIYNIEGAQRTRVDHCAYGGSSVKPTDLLAAHMPALARTADEAPHKGRCTRGRRATCKRSLTGLDGGGRWKTSECKE